MSMLKTNVAAAVSPSLSTKTKPMDSFIASVILGSGVNLYAPVTISSARVPDPVLIVHSCEVLLKEPILAPPDVEAVRVGRSYE